MDLNEIWLAYVNEHMSAGAERKAPVSFTAGAVLERLFEVHPTFTRRWEAISATSYSAAFDEEADGALAQLVLSDTFDGWEAISAGAWRVLAERLLFTETVLAVMVGKHPDAVTDRLPHGLSHSQQTKALLLKLLLGQGRTIDRRLLRPKPDGSLPTFPASLPLRPH